MGETPSYQPESNYKGQGPSIWQLRKDYLSKNGPAIKQSEAESYYNQVWTAGQRIDTAKDDRSREEAKGLLDSSLKIIVEKGLRDYIVSGDQAKYAPALHSSQIDKINELADEWWNKHSNEYKQ